MKVFPIIAAAAFTAVFASGCSNTSRFNYSAAYGSMPMLMPLPGNPTVGVLPAEDCRDAVTYPDDDNANETSGSYYLGMIPFMPFGWHTMRHPEQSGEFATLSQFDFKPAEDLAEAAALSLKTSRLFAQVKRVRDPQNSACTYLWRTRLNSTKYRGFLITYGITYIGAPFLWLIGFPDGLSSARLAVDFELIDCATGKVVWNFRNDLGDTLWHWMYARIGADADLYARMLKYALSRALTDLSGRYPGIRPAQAAKPEAAASEKNK